MKYSDAFERLHEMSLDIHLMSEVKYKRVATFIGRVMMANGDMPSYVHGSKERPITVTLPWIAQLQGFKEKIIPLVIQLTDVEWKKIHGMMLLYASHSRGGPQWKSLRIEWAHALETLREFERDC
jgi:hypothetical protein